MAKNIITPKVVDKLNTELPHSSIVTLERNRYIREQIVADNQEVLNDGLFGSNEWHNLKGNGIENSFDRENFISNNVQVGSFYIPINELLNLLFDSNFSGENAIIGFWIFFTKTAKYDSPKIILTKAGKTASGRTRILTEDYLLLKYDKKPTAKTTLNNLTSADSLIRPSITELRTGFTAPIKGYFIGRQAIMKMIADSEGNIPTNIKGVEMDVRKGRAYDMVSTTTDYYSVIFSLFYQGLEPDVLGIATKIILPEHIRIVLGGGGSSSRPCPTYCPE